MGFKMSSRSEPNLPEDGERVYAKLVHAMTRELMKAALTERRAKGLTRADLAAKLGRHPGFVSRKLSGTNMTLRTIAAFLAALGYDLDVRAYRWNSGSARNVSNSSNYAVERPSRALEVTTQGEPTENPPPKTSSSSRTVEMMPVPEKRVPEKEAA